ncbi:MAG: hypothetical protein LBD63_02460 [Mycoplasmataceae bacterium]|nr:hypothetical protein [Mycoplasmataceae bacterium]
MKNTQSITLTEIQQKIEVIEIQLKLLFKSYQDLVTNFLIWRVDNTKQPDDVTKQKLGAELELIMSTLDKYTGDIARNIIVANQIANRVEKTKSPSMIKAMEHAIFKIDEVLSRCNMYTFIMDESEIPIGSVLNFTKEVKKRILN